MLGFEDTLKTIRRELEETSRLVDGLSAEDWSRPTRCAEWTVTDLVTHIGDAANYQGEAFRRMLSGSMDVPDVPEHRAGDPEEAAQTFRGGRDHLLAALEEITPEQADEPVPLPFSVFPASIAAIVALIEYGFHRNDLEWALGDERPLSEDVASTMIATLGGFLPQVESQPPDGPLAYRFEAPSGTLVVASDGGDWTATEETSAPTCVIAGDDSTVSLFALGRIPADTPGLTVSGERADEAKAFKRYFPGP